MRKISFPSSSTSNSASRVSKKKSSSREVSEFLHCNILTISEAAAFQLRKLQGKDKAGFGLRVEVSPGGCAGYQYFLDFEKKPSEHDVVYEEKGFRLHIDPVSADFLEGTVLDYEETLKASGFRFNNPNVSHSCRCGKSVC